MSSLSRRMHSSILKPWLCGAEQNNAIGRLETGEWWNQVGRRQGISRTKDHYKALESLSVSQDNLYSTRKTRLAKDISPDGEAINVRQVFKPDGVFQVLIRRSNISRGRQWCHVRREDSALYVKERVNHPVTFSCFNVEMEDILRVVLDVNVLLQSAYSRQIRVIMHHCSSRSGQLHKGSEDRFREAIGHSYYAERPRRISRTIMPSLSPDLNPDEHLWDELDWRERKRQPKP